MSQRHMHVSIVSGGEVELGFMLDTSTSLGGEANLKITLDFIKAVYGSFTISSSAYRVGVVIFGSSAKVAFDFSKFSSSAEIESGLSEIKLIGGATAAGQGLTTCNTALFSKARSSAKKMLLVLIAGKSSDDVGVASSMKTSGISIFVLGMGKAIDKTQLNMMASQESYIQIAAEFSQVASLSSQFVGYIKQVSGSAEGGATGNGTSSNGGTTGSSTTSSGESGTTSTGGNTGSGTTSSGGNTGSGTTSSGGNTGSGTTTGGVNTGSGTTTGGLNTGSGTTTGGVNSGSGTTTSGVNTGSGTTTGGVNTGSGTTTGEVNTGSGTTTGGMNTGSGTTTGGVNTGSGTTSESGTTTSGTTESRTKELAKNLAKEEGQKELLNTLAEKGVLNKQGEAVVNEKNKQEGKATEENKQEVLKKLGESGLLNENGKQMLVQEDQKAMLKDLQRQGLLSPQGEEMLNKQGVSGVVQSLGAGKVSMAGTATVGGVTTSTGIGGTTLAGTSTVGLGTNLNGQTGIGVLPGTLNTGTGTSIGVNSGQNGEGSVFSGTPSSTGDITNPALQEKILQQAGIPQPQALAQSGLFTQTGQILLTQLRQQGLLNSQGEQLGNMIQQQVQQPNGVQARPNMPGTLPGNYPDTLSQTNYGNKQVGEIVLEQALLNFPTFYLIHDTMAVTTSKNDLQNDSLKKEVECE
ncbi:predicted protein [Nematostella vectensis]|uniref:VWFA domain-containing protein n=1 Tax=Nematostella vectensis TaxID=45351 RepID=A7SV33_NEMVE|nr:predicted protein [Nematostella vectensis]|eukprot:XP_001624546.1 predicted protein [Nematostella vectensis]